MSFTTLESSLSATGDKYVFVQKLRDFISAIYDFMQEKKINLKPIDSFKTQASISSKLFFLWVKSITLLFRIRSLVNLSVLVFKNTKNTKTKMDSTETTKSTQNCGTEAGSSNLVSSEQHQETESSENIGDSKKRSKVWLYFVKTDIFDKAKCIHCGSMISCRTKHGSTTSAMLNHLSRCKLMLLEEGDGENDGKKLKQSTLLHHNQMDGIVGSKVPSYVAFSQPASRKALVEMIIMDELPFRFVEHKGFRRFMSVLQPRFEIPCRQMVTKDCLELYEC